MDHQIFCSVICHPLYQLPSVEPTRHTLFLGLRTAVASFLPAPAPARAPSSLPAAVRVCAPPPSPPWPLRDVFPSSPVPHQGARAMAACARRNLGWCVRADRGERADREGHGAVAPCRSDPHAVAMAKLVRTTVEAMTKLVRTMTSSDDAASISPARRVYRYGGSSLPPSTLAPLPPS
jgi:hypothetical protein